MVRRLFCCFCVSVPNRRLQEVKYTDSILLDSPISFSLQVDRNSEVNVVAGDLNRHIPTYYFKGQVSTFFKDAYLTVCFMFRTTDEQALINGRARWQEERDTYCSV